MTVTLDQTAPANAAEQQNKATTKRLMRFMIYSCTQDTFSTLAMMLQLPVPWRFTVDPESLAVCNICPNMAP